jgi:uncharacterized membrane protein YgcG
MSAKRDRTNNEMVIPFYIDEALTAGVTYNSTAYDSMLGRSDPTNMLLILMMKTWGTGGRIVCRVQDCMTQTGTFVTFCNFASANQAGGNTTFVGQANRFRRWIRLRIDCIAASVSLTAVGVLARGRREPVTNQALVEELSAGSSESSSSSSSSSESSSSSSSSSSSESSSSSSSSSSS